MNIVSGTRWFGLRANQHVTWAEIVDEGLRRGNQLDAHCSSSWLLHLKCDRVAQHVQHVLLVASCTNAALHSQLLLSANGT